MTEIHNLGDLADYAQRQIRPGEESHGAATCAPAPERAIAAAQRQYAERAGHRTAPAGGTRPSAQALAQLEDGMTRLDSLAAGLNRITRQHGPAR